MDPDSNNLFKNDNTIRQMEHRLDFDEIKEFFYFKMLNDIKVLFEKFLCFWNSN